MDTANALIRWSRSVRTTRNVNPASYWGACIHSSWVRWCLYCLPWPEFRSLEESSQVGECKSGRHTEVFPEGLGHQSALHHKLALALPDDHVWLTIMPDSGGGADDFSFIFLMIVNAADTKTHDSQRGEFPGCIRISFCEWIHIFGVRNHCFEFAPWNLGVCWNDQDKWLQNAYPLVINLGIFDLEPEWTFEHKKFKCACIGSKYPQNVWTAGIHGHLWFWQAVSDWNENVKWEAHHWIHKRLSSCCSLHVEPLFLQKHTSFSPILLARTLFPAPS